MTLDQKRIVIAVLAIFFLLSLILVQSIEVARRYEEVGLVRANVAVPATSRNCVDCHGQSTPGIIDHWKGSTHASTGVGCVDCHQARDGDADGFLHYGRLIATVVTPRDCSRCHQQVFEEFSRSHHAAAGNILASLDNFLAETVEGARMPFDPHSPTPGMAVDQVNGLASAFSGCQQCHGSKVAMRSTSGGMVTVDDLATCASCHMSGNLRNDGRITHDPGERISWSNRPPVSLVMDTDLNHGIVTATDPAERRRLTVDTAEAKRNRMKNVCSHCHTPDYINSFYRQYDDFVILYNEKFAKPGQAIMAALEQQGLLTPTQFDEKIEWTWFYLWHHEGRRARHGVSMMAPDYTHWHGMYEGAERFYVELVPEARHLAAEAATRGQAAAARAVNQAIDGILARPEHAWFEQGADEAAQRIREAMREKYGQTR
jgi:hypothetical protein